MDQQAKTHLEAKVIATNRANAEANRLYALFVIALAPFVGKKVINTDGSFPKKVKEAIDAIPTTAFQLLRRFTRNNILDWTVKECERYGEHFCDYAEATFYVGVLDGQVLRDLDIEPPNFRTDYNVERILQAREIVQKAREHLSRAQGALEGFGECDR